MEENSEKAEKAFLTQVKIWGKMQTTTSIKKLRGRGLVLWEKQSGKN